MTDGCVGSKQTKTFSGFSTPARCRSGEWRGHFERCLGDQTNAIVIATGKNFVSCCHSWRAIGALWPKARRPVTGSGYPVSPLRGRFLHDSTIDNAGRRPMETIESGKAEGREQTKIPAGLATCRERTGPTWFTVNTQRRSPRKRPFLRSSLLNTRKRAMNALYGAGPLALTKSTSSIYLNINNLYLN